MKKQLIIIGIIFILFCIGFSGCNKLDSSYSIEKSKFVGTWIYSIPSGTGSNYSFVYCFFSNDTFSFNKNGLVTNGTFDIIDGKLWLINNVNGNDEYDKYSYGFSENNTVLTVDGTPYLKQ